MPRRMRLSILGLSAYILPLALVQAQKSEEILSDEVVSDTPTVLRPTVPPLASSSTVGSVVATSNLTATETVTAPSNETEVEQVTAWLAFGSTEGKGANYSRNAVPKDGRPVTIDNVDDRLLLNVTVESGPCGIWYEGLDDEIIAQIKFGKDGGEYAYTFDAVFIQIYCGELNNDQPGGDDEDEDEDIEIDDYHNANVTCADSGNGTVQIQDVCCKPTGQWDPYLWNKLEMDDYFKESIDVWNEEGWPASIPRTYAEYDHKTKKKSDDFWNWHCDSITSNQCQVGGLLNSDHCLENPQRALALQTLQNFASMWHEIREKFQEGVLAQVLTKTPALARHLFPQGDDSFSIDDYPATSWIMIAGGIIGLIFSFFPPFWTGAGAAYGAMAAGVSGGILWQIGLALGPPLTHAVEQDPHFTFWADFSADVADTYIKPVLQVLGDIFDAFFVNQLEGDSVKNATALQDIFKEGSFMQPLVAQGIRDVRRSDLQTDSFLAPVINHAWQQQKLYIVKLPKGGLYVERDDDYNMAYAPCSGHGGDWQGKGYWFDYMPDKRDWHAMPADYGRCVCTEYDGDYIFLPWKETDGNRWEAWDNYGWEEVEKQGFKLEEIVKSSVSSQEKAKGYSRNPESAEDYAMNIVEAVEEDVSFIRYFNLPVCDLSKLFGNTYIDACYDDRTHNGRGTQGLDPYYCIASIIETECAKQTKDGEKFPYIREEDEKKEEEEKKEKEKKDEEERKEREKKEEEEKKEKEEEEKSKLWGDCKVNSRVVDNWSEDRLYRVKIHFHMSYDEDDERVKKTIKERKKDHGDDEKDWEPERDFCDMWKAWDIKLGSLGAPSKDSCISNMRGNLQCWREDDGQWQIDYSFHDEEDSQIDCWMEKTREQWMEDTKCGTG